MVEESGPVLAILAQLGSSLSSEQVVGEAAVDVNTNAFKLSAQKVSTAGDATLGNGIIRGGFIPTEN